MRQSHSANPYATTAIFPELIGADNLRKSPTRINPKA